MRDHNDSHMLSQACGNYFGSTPESRGSYFPTDDNTTSTESSELQNPSLTQLSLDDDGRIQPYVSFDLYYQSVDEARANKLISDNEFSLYK